MDGPRPRSHRPLLGYGLTLLAATLFAVNGSVSKLAIDVDGMTTLRWTQIRSTGAFIGLALVLAFARPALLRIRRSELPRLIVYSIVGFALVQWLYLVAITRLPIGIGLIIEFTAPVLIALWARFAWHEPVRRRVWLALVLTIAGLGLIARVWEGATLDTIGMLAGFSAAAALALYYLMGQRLVEKHEALSIVCISLGLASVFWAVVQPLWSFPFETLGETVELPRLELGVPVAAFALWTVVLGAIVPFALSVSALRYLPATTVGIVATFEPVAAATVAWLWLGESLVAAQILGGLVVLVGIVLAETSR